MYNLDTGILWGLLAVYLVFILAISIFMTIVQWKIFVKAGEPGWAVLVPFYGSYVMAKITFGNGWLFLLAAIPLVNIVFLIMMTNRLSKAFGHGVGFTFGLLFLAFIFYPILAFGSSEYTEPY